MPDDADFPDTCDVELALVVRDPELASKLGYALTRYSDDVLIAEKTCCHAVLEVVLASSGG